MSSRNFFVVGKIRQWYIMAQRRTQGEQQDLDGIRIRKKLSIAEVHTCRMLGLSLLNPTDRGPYGPATPSSQFSAWAALRVEESNGKTNLRCQAEYTKQEP